MSSKLQEIRGRSDRPAAGGRKAVCVRPDATRSEFPQTFPFRSFFDTLFLWLMHMPPVGKRAGRETGSRTRIRIGRPNGNEGIPK